MHIYVPKGAYMCVGTYVYSFSYRYLSVQPQTFVRSEGRSIPAGKNFPVQGRRWRYTAVRGERGEGCYDK